MFFAGHDTSQDIGSGIRFRPEPAGNGAFPASFLQDPHIFPQEPAGKKWDLGSSIPGRKITVPGNVFFQPVPDIVNEAELHRIQQENLGKP